MVGRKTSGKCENCRRLKIKCNLSQPACLQCVRRKCVCRYDVQARFHVVDFQEPKASSEISLLHPPPESPIDSLRSGYVYMRQHNRLTARFWTTQSSDLTVTNVLDFIPQRLGEYEALDDAVKCISLADPTGKRYMKALHSLQTALNDLVGPPSSETLAAAMVLYLREIHFSPYQRVWAVHAQGLINLLKARGVGGMSSDLDRQIVKDMVGTLFTCAIYDGTPSFLARSNLLGGSVVLPSPTLRHTQKDAISSLVSLNTLLPGLLCRYEKLQLIGDCISPSPLIRDIYQLQQHLVAWYRLEGQECPLDAWSAAVKMTSSAIMVLTSLMLANLTAAFIDVPQISILEQHCRDFAAATKAEYLFIMSRDAVAAWACPVPLVIMFRRALKASTEANPVMKAVDIIAHDLHDWLIDNARGPRWPYAVDTPLEGDISTYTT